MKKLFTSFALIISFSVTTFAQLPNGSIAPDWVLTDINGNEHHLYDYLDDGYSVVIDFFYVSCHPCWTYHTSGALEELYINHGPAGMPNVSENTTDDVMVFAIEGDEYTTTDQLYGNSGGTQGNWVEGTPYPIFETHEQSEVYEINYWPTIYTICPDKTIRESGQRSTAEHYQQINSCASPQFTTDARMLSLVSPSSYCGDEYIAEVLIQNFSVETTLTEATITVAQNANTLLTYDWTGTLETYQLDYVTLPPFTGFNHFDPVRFTINVENDMDSDNNSFSDTIFINSTEKKITVEILTDIAANETSWDLRDSGGNIISSGNNLTPETLHTVDVDLPNVDCYEFTIYDTYGDGLCCYFGEGYYKLKDENGVTIASGDEFKYQATEPFHNDVAVAISEEILVIANLNIYPNPIAETATVVFNLAQRLDTKIEIVNILGEVVYIENWGILSIGTHHKTLNLNRLKSTTYFLNIICEGNISSQKITISK